jgi:hypothetical protein
MSDRYHNKRMVFRRSGRYAKAPSLEGLGFDVNTVGELTCRGCGKTSTPLVISGTCCHCGLERAFIHPEALVDG